MLLIRCGGCDAIHPADDPVCVVCGRCPHCGKRRLAKIELQALRQCVECLESNCDCCGRCLNCGQRPQIELIPCECGHPTAETAARLAASSGFKWAGANGAGCSRMLAGLVLAWVVLMSSLSWFAST